MPILRTKFKGEIIAEFLPPSRIMRSVEHDLGVRGRLRGKRKIEVVDEKAKVIILLQGAPAIPSKSSLIEFWSKKGYWVFFPRYRGTWESGGKFLEKSPENDVIDVIDSFNKAFRDYWNEVDYKIDPKKIILICSSFGGPAGIFASRDKRVDKIIAMCPVVDWKELSPQEGFDKFQNFVNNLFGGAYRGSAQNWKKLERGEMYNPVNHIEEIDGNKILIFQTKDDTSVSWRPVASFAKKVGAKLKLYKKGEHFGLGPVMKPSFTKQILAFIKKK
ncbi:MAG: prolyl oligopeptidase family serine peptidase [Parcubacteria group bacterium]